MQVDAQEGLVIGRTWGWTTVLWFPTVVSSRCGRREGGWRELEISDLHRIYSAVLAAAGVKVSGFGHHFRALSAEIRSIG